MAWISTINGNAARDRNSYCALSLLPRSNGTQCDGGTKERMKNRNGTVKRVWLPGVLFFFDAKKRVPITMDKRLWLWSRRGSASRGKKGDEGGKKEKKSVDGRKAFQNWPIFHAVRRRYPRFVQRINVLGPGLSAMIFLSSPQLDSLGEPIGMNEWTCVLSLSLSFSPPTNIKYRINEARG